ncbi:MAG: DUF11 domain-containing protein [Xanthomonadales bacterium]|nr:DUF11 domain-containing protein [Xanthomonadales bacterium]
MKLTYRSALILAAAAALAAPASAGELRVAAGSSAATVEAGSGFAMTIRNQGSGTLDGVRVLSDRNHPVRCAAVTAGGRGFAGAGRLLAGDSVACSGRSLAPRGKPLASVVVIARDGQGKPVQTHASFVLEPAATPDQGIVAVLGGGVHDDANGDGLLDAGETIDYHYTVLNLGNGALSGLGVADQDGAVSCPATTLAVGAAMACTRQHTVTAAEAGDGFVMNEVGVSGSDSFGGSVHAADVVLRMDLGGAADIRGLKSPFLADDADGSGYASEGDLITYTFAVKNSGGLALSAVNLTEPDPGLIDTPITCATTTLGGQPFAGLGSGVLASNDVVLCTADHTITAADAAAGEARNLAELGGQPSIGGRVTGAAASAVVIPLPATVEVTKALVAESGSQPGIAEPGETLTYAIRLGNSGSTDALNVGIIDPLDPNVVFVSADNGGVLAGGNVAWSGLTVPAGGHLDLGIVVRVADPLPADVRAVGNLAYEAGGVPPDCEASPLPAGCVITPTPGTIDISKALVAESGSKPGVAEPGETLTYAITLENRGGSAVTGFSVTDPLDPYVGFVSADHGGSHAAGVVTWAGLTIPAGGSVVLTVVVEVADFLPPGVARVANVAHESGTPPVDCSLVPLPASCAVIPADEAPRLQVTKSANAGSVVPGGTATFVVTVRNVGTIAVNNMTVSDPLPAGVSGFNWTCAAAGGASCANASGSGPLGEVIAVFPPGGELVYTIAAAVSDSASGELLNTVLVEPSALTACMPGGTPAPCDATATVTVVAAAVPHPVPVDGRLALMLMALALAFLGARRSGLRS